MPTKRLVELSAIALRFRRDCLRFAACTDLGEDLRQRFREDADHWATISRKILRNDWSSGYFCRDQLRHRDGEQHSKVPIRDGDCIP